jgi:uncharacterized protein (TIGR03437 family)
LEIRAGSKRGVVKVSPQNCGVWPDNDLHAPRYRWGETGAFSMKWIGMLTLSLSFISAAPRLSLPNISTAADSEVVVTVSLVTGGPPISALQFDLHYDPSVISFSIIPGQATRDALKRIYIADVSSDTKRFLIVGLNGNTIQEGSVVELIMYLSPQATPGTYGLGISKVFAADPDGDSVLISSVNGSVTVQGSLADSMRIGPDGVLNSASFTSGPVSPGEYLTLFGAGIAATASVDQPPIVLFDGVPSPVLYAKANQINIVTPFAISQAAVTKMQVILQAQKIAEVSLSVGAVAPGLFTLDGSGVGPGAILNQDSTVNTPLNPADRASVVVLYATGSGQTNPHGVDGQIASVPLPSPVLPVGVEIGGIAAEVLYAGAAPGFVAGLLQVNCLVPKQIAPGDSVPVILKIGTSASQQGVSIAVK